MKSNTLAILILLITLSGCAGWTTPVVKTLGNVPAGEAIVLGQVKVVVNEVDLLREGGFGHSRSNMYSGFIVCIVPEVGNTFWYLPVDEKKGEEIYWHLPPGNYSVVAIKYRNSIDDEMHHETTRFTLPMLVRFTIPNNKQLVYIGSLMITFNDLGSLGSKNFGLRIEDKYEDAISALRLRFPVATDNVAKSLMSPEKTR